MPQSQNIALFFCISCSLLLLSEIECSPRKELEEYFKWKQITFASLNQDGVDTEGIVFPYEYDREIARSSQYIAGNNVPMGASHHGDRIFITIPRRRPGVPFTLNYVPTKNVAGSNNMSPALMPFPDSRTNDLHPRQQPDPTRIVSVYRTHIDECNQLWFVDTGLLEYPNNRTQVQPPSIWVYDLTSFRIPLLINRFEIPEAIVANGNGLASLTVDTDVRNCDNAYAYLPDLAVSQLHVYSLRQNRMWSFRHNFFHMNPQYGDFDVAGVQFQWDDGIFSITLGNRMSNGYRDVFFHPMVSISEFVVSSRILQDEQMANRSNHGNDFKLLGHRGDFTQSTMHAFDRRSGVIFFAQIATSGISCWNTATNLSPQTHELLAQNNATMIYPSDLNIDNDGNIWVFTNTMPRFLYARLNPNEYNFRLWRASPADLIRGSRCDVHSRPHSSYAFNPRISGTTEATHP